MTPIEYVPADAFTRQFSNIYKDENMEIKRFSEEVKTAARIAAERPHAHGSWINAVTPILEEAAAKMYAPKPEPVKVGDKVKILNDKSGAPNKTVGCIGEVCDSLGGGIGLRVKFANGERWCYERREVELLPNVDWRARAERAEARLEAMRAAMETYMRSHPDSETSYVLATLACVGWFTVKPRVIRPAPPIEPLCVLDQAA
jgi:hypothetical protein